MSKSLLFSPVVIGRHEFKNRVFMSPMCMYNSEPDTGLLDSRRFDHYVTRAAGGVGAIVMEATAVVPDGGISRQDLGLWDDSQIAPLAELVNKVHSYGTKIGIQLAHAGRKAYGRDVIWSSSANGKFNEDEEIYIEPTPLTEAQIKDLVKAFGQAAYRAVQAGFDFVEIHAAHGYLINQFISPLTNFRTDNYGGSLEKRYNFLGEIIRAIRETADIDIHLRLSASEVEEAGNSLDDIRQIMAWAQEDGVVFFDISSGGVTKVPPKIFPGYQALISAQLADQFRVGAVGLINEPFLAEYILRAKHAEVIYLARPLLNDPYWCFHAAKVLHDEEGVDLPIPSYVRGVNKA
ncbi:oxidoreductase [Psittacicella hinzii]|uniref:NADH:flavin oxidoreductase/NADH oxidase N-terminal domain-containing protein n=1 Tax=Psittacicella hinzii TaxID=2028575 RepID=A0A3A1YJJ3_9GAMM|nr:NADPH dehydrogenase [Psittacicella hinzii]RIY38443.1 hypothetical protein CKF58_04280 [Psittacicella hinzii]